MIAFLLFLIAITWLALQGRASRQPVWARRWDAVGAALLPVVRYVKADIRAVRNHMRLARRKRVDWDDEWRKLDG